jgi:nitrate/nitrite-specific signal transduction histidine kinase
MVLFGVLAAIALLPLRGIETVASRVWRGDFGARVGSSPVADRDMKRIGTTFNLLLDGLVADRTRMRALATAVIDAGDRERASLARELRDSTAQQLAALVLQLRGDRRGARWTHVAREHARLARHDREGGVRQRVTAPGGERL